jgi:hypothetical protein
MLKAFPVVLLDGKKVIVQLLTKKKGQKPYN